MERAQAEKAVRAGSTAAFIAAAFTAAVGIFFLLAAPTEFGELGLDAWLLVDAALIAFLAWKIRGGSRAAGITLLVYFLVSKVSLSLAAGRPSGLGVSLIFLYFYFNATRGAFVLHRVRVDEDPDYRPTRRWVVICGSVAACLLLAIMGFGLLLESGLIPDTAVVAGDRLHDKVPAFLMDQGMIQAGEEIVLFYSTAPFDFRKEGNVLTDRRVLVYQEFEGELWFSSFYYDQIVEVSVEHPGGLFDDAIVRVYDKQGEALRLWVSPEAGGLDRVLEELDRRTDETGADGRSVRAAPQQGGDLARIAPRSAELAHSVRSVEPASISDPGRGSVKWQGGDLARIASAIRRARSLRSLG